MTSLLRIREPHGHAQVTNIELFFDLVFVFAITQIAHSFLADLTPAGADHALLMLFAVWWVWIYTSWITNWLDPERAQVRVLLLVLMLAGLVLSASLPEAFGVRGLAFALAYVFMQVGQTFFMLWALGKASPANRRNFQRIAVWLCTSGVLWIVGGLLGGDAQVPLWTIAVALEYAGPIFGFTVPGLGRSLTTDWDVEGGHLAERCSLFIIIALGEAILDTGASFAESAWDAAEIVAFVIGFIGSIAMWWIYFDTGAERGAKKITQSGDPGRMARLAYTYLHLPIVAGIIVAAVANELVLAHPDTAPDAFVRIVILAGPVVYLAGNAAFKHTITHRWPLSHLIGFALFILLAAVMPMLSGQAIAAAATAILVVVAVWETRSLRGGWMRPTPP